MLMACMSFGNDRIMSSTCLGIPERLWRSAVSSSTCRVHGSTHVSGNMVGGGEANQRNKCWLEYVLFVIHLHVPGSNFTF